MDIDNYIRDVVSASHPNDLQELERVSQTLQKHLNDNAMFDSTWNGLEQDFKLDLFIWISTFANLKPVLDKIITKLNQDYDNH